MKQSKTASVGVEQFGAHLRALRTRQGLTLEELAHRCDLSYSQVVRIELAQINTGIYTVFLLAAGLKLPAKDLFDFSISPLDPDPASE